MTDKNEKYRVPGPVRVTPTTPTPENNETAAIMEGIMNVDYAQDPSMLAKGMQEAFDHMIVFGTGEFRKYSDGNGDLRYEAVNPLEQTNGNRKA